jgi:signal transduction histidine kinase
MIALRFFYVLVAYLLLQFGWWSYLLIKQNNEIYNYRKELLQLKNDGTLRSQDQKELQEYLHRRWLMIAGEGLVFGTLLMVGIYLTRQSFQREFILSNQQRNFLLAVTHEFKSPLAAIKLSLQTLSKHQLDESQRHQVLERALKETGRIHELIENALAAARYEDKFLQLQKEPVNLSHLVSQVIENKKNLSMRPVHIVSQIDPDIIIHGDPLALQSALSNLLDNAEKYSPDNGRIDVSLSASGKQITLRVADQGPGISSAEKARIFKKFYRSGREESRGVKGTGLGLYIVKNVVQLHGGKVTVSDNVPRGAVFEIVLKR